MVTSEITIDGNGSTIMRGSGSPDFRIFAVSGITPSSGNLTLQETTVSGGKTSGNFEDGGGVFNYGILTLTNSTISGNSTSGDGSYGGGVLNYRGTLTLTRTLISGNTTPLGLGSEVASTPIRSPNAYNLFGHSGLTTAQALIGVTPGATDITATSDGTTPTALGSILNTTLANNGGPTQTHALVTGSPAVDAVTDQSCPPPNTDQRGILRPQGAACDIGSFELASAPLCNGLAPTMGCKIGDALNQLCVGTMGGETIRGTSGADVIHGLGGNDTIIGLQGDDTICGGEGRDRLRGEDGTDTCDGGNGRDRASGCETVISVP